MSIDVDELASMSPSWMADALCAEFPSVNFFAERGESVEPAKAVCARCLVAADCRDYATVNAIAFGTWGGTSPRQREAARRPAQPDRPLHPCAEECGRMIPIGRTRCATCSSRLTRTRRAQRTQQAA